MRLQSLLGRKDGRPKTSRSRNLRPSCRGAPLEMCLCPDPLQFPFQTERKRHSACEPIFRRRPACLLPASPPCLASSSSGATHKSFQSQALPPLSLLLSLSLTHSFSLASCLACCSPTPYCHDFGDVYHSVFSVKALDTLGETEQFTSSLQRRCFPFAVPRTTVCRHRQLSPPAFWLV